MGGAPAWEAPRDASARGAPPLRGALMLSGDGDAGEVPGTSHRHVLASGTAEAQWWAGGQLEGEIARCDEATRFADLAADLARNAATRLQAVWRGTLARDALERAWEEGEEAAAAALIQVAWREVRSRRREVRSRPCAGRHGAPRASLHVWQSERRAASAHFGLLHGRGGAVMADVVRAAVAMRKGQGSALLGSALLGRDSALAEFSRERPLRQQSDATLQARAKASVERPRASDPRAARAIEDAAVVVQASWRGLEGRRSLQQQWWEEERGVAAGLLQAAWRDTTAADRAMGRKWAAARVNQKRLDEVARPTAQPRLPQPRQTKGCAKGCSTSAQEPLDLELDLELEAITRLQALWRGFSAREQLLLELLAQREAEAATRIQVLFCVISLTSAQPQPQPWPQPRPQTQTQTQTQTRP